MIVSPRLYFCSKTWKKRKRGLGKKRSKRWFLFFFFIKKSSRCPSPSLCSLERRLLVVEIRMEVWIGAKGGEEQSPTRKIAMSCVTSPDDELAVTGGGAKGEKETSPD